MTKKKHRSLRAAAFAGALLALILAPARPFATNGCLPEKEAVSSDARLEPLFRQAIARIDPARPESTLPLESFAREAGDPTWEARAAVRLACEEISAGRSELALARLRGAAGRGPAALSDVARRFEAEALAASGRTVEAARVLVELLGGEAPAKAVERLSLALLDGERGFVPLPDGERLELARVLAERGGDDETRGRAFLGALLPLLRAVGAGEEYRAALDRTLLRAPMAVLRTRGIARDARTAADLAAAARQLSPAARLERARLFASLDETAVALAELGKIDVAGLSPPEAAEARVLAAELEVRVGQHRSALARTENLAAPGGPLLERLLLTRAEALLGAATHAPKPIARRGRRGKAPLPPPVSVSVLPEEALRLLERLDRDDVAPTVRRKALDLLVEKRLGGLDLEKGLPLFEKKEKLFPESRSGRELLWNRAFPLYREGDPAAALPLLDSLSLSSEEATARKGAYWAARSRLALGRIEEAAKIFESLAGSPAADFYARHSVRRLAELGRTVPPQREWRFPEPPPEALSAWSNPRQRELDRLGLWTEALEELPPRSEESPLGLELRRAELLALSGERDRAMHLVKQVHPAIQTAAVTEIPERELRLFYPIAFEEPLAGAARKYGLDLPALAGLVRQESGFRPVVRSSAGALGIMQIMPATARMLGRRMFAKPVSPGHLADPDLSIDMGSFFLRDLIDRLGGEWELALAGYNAGPGRVATVKKRYPRGDVDLWVESLPFAETRDYVKKIVLYESVYRKLYPQLDARPTRGDGVVAGR
jgi:soluble lytic murein transglycosylase-like protein